MRRRGVDRVYPAHASRIGIPMCAAGLFSGPHESIDSHSQTKMRPASHHGDSAFIDTLKGCRVLLFVEL
jgi:hypothetical protein